MIPESSCYDHHIALAVNSQAVGFTPRANARNFTPGDALHTPALGFHEVAGNSGVAPNCLVVQPFAKNVDDADFDIRIYGWKKRMISNGVYSYKHLLLAEYACTCSSVVADEGSLTFLCDILVQTWGDDGSGSRAYTNGNDLAGAFVVDLLGSEWIDFDFQKGTATEMNALFWYQN